MALKPSRSITSSAKGWPLRSERAHSSVRPLHQMAAVADAGEVVEQREIRDLVAQPVHRHQQEAEIHAIDRNTSTRMTTDCTGLKCM
jgi:ABC-type methionine transport system ATPase subunit